MFLKFDPYRVWCSIFYSKQLRFLTEIGRFHWNQGEEVAHFAWFGEPWLASYVLKVHRIFIVHVILTTKCLFNWHELSFWCTDSNWTHENPLLKILHSMSEITVFFSLCLKWQLFHYVWNNSFFTMSEITAVISDIVKKLSFQT
jgi:hypothetical protein